MKLLVTLGAGATRFTTDTTLCAREYINVEGDDGNDVAYVAQDSTVSSSNAEMAIVGLQADKMTVDKGSFPDFIRLSDCYAIGTAGQKLFVRYV